MKTALFSAKSYDEAYFDRLNQTHQLTFFDTQLNAKTAYLARGFEAVCVFVNDKVDAPTIRILHEGGVKLIVLRCAGFNNVAIEEAKKYGIKVLRVPAYSPNAVAEHAVSLILTLNRKTHKAYNRVREGNFSVERLTGFNLQGKTVGVIGTGKIGAVFCKIMLGFECQVIAHDLQESEALKQKGVVYHSLEEVLAMSDIISLHCPLLPATKHLIGEEAIEKMKHGVMLINTSRGALIDTKAAIRGLKSGKIGYLGIDVYEQEETLFFNDLSESVIQDDVIMRLLSFPNVLITAHQAFFTTEALEEITLTTLQNLTNFENGEFLENEVMV